MKRGLQLRWQGEAAAAPGVSQQAHSGRQGSRAGPPSGGNTGSQQGGVWEAEALSGVPHQTCPQLESGGGLAHRGRQGGAALIQGGERFCLKAPPPEPRLPLLSPEPAPHPFSLPTSISGTRMAECSLGNQTCDKHQEGCSHFRDEKTKAQKVEKLPVDLAARKW